MARMVSSPWLCLVREMRFNSESHFSNYCRLAWCSMQTEDAWLSCPSSGRHTERESVDSEEPGENAAAGLRVPPSHCAYIEQTAGGTNAQATCDPDGRSACQFAAPTQPPPPKPRESLDTARRLIVRRGCIRARLASEDAGGQPGSVSAGGRVRHRSAYRGGCHLWMRAYLLAPAGWQRRIRGSSSTTPIKVYRSS